ncbi:hypothetical protein AB0896_25860 [Streptomyces parvulus]
MDFRFTTARGDRVQHRINNSLARPLADQDRTTLLEAVRTAVGGALTEEDIRLISNRKCGRRLKTARS